MASAFHDRQATAVRPAPVELGANLQQRFYRGGHRIARLRGVALPGPRCPEDWVGAVTPIHGSDGEGLTRLPDGRLLRDAIAADPEGWLGARHVQRLGPDPRLLVKLLDAGERLPVHLHPGTDFARTRLGAPSGKTEAWVVLEAVAGASVRVGFDQPTSEADLAALVHGEDADGLLSALREVPVAAGDVLLVPAGIPHAIGAGILLLELQEPSDLSILLERSSFGVTEESAHLGLGWEAALSAVSLAPWSDDYGRVAAPWPRAGVTPLLPPAANAYFRAELVRPARTIELEPGFAILVTLDGSGTLAGERDDRPMLLGRGTTALVPHAAGAPRIEGDVTVVVCRPPDPDAEGRPW
jgi:mannose-6-phosphate isomerase